MGRYDPTTANMCIAGETLLQCRVPGYVDHANSQCLLRPQQTPNRSTPIMKPAPANRGAVAAQEQTEAIVIELDDMLEWMERTGIAAYELGLDHGEDILVGEVLRRQLSEFGWTGKMRVQTYANGKQYVIFSGRPGLRKVLQGTRYLSNNTKIVSMGIGQQGLKSLSRVGGVVTFVLVAWEAATYVMDDEKTVYDVTGFVVTESVKIAITSVLAGVAMTLAAGATSVVVAPLAAGLAVGIVVGWALSEVDERFQITQAVSNFFEEQHKSWQRSWSDAWREYWRWEEHLRKGGRFPF